VASSPLKLFPELLSSNEGGTSQIDEVALKKLYAQFAMTVYDSLISSTASTSVQKFRSTCEKLWPRFIWPVVSGESPQGKASSWDFARLLVRNRGLFQAQGENALHEQLRPRGEAWSFAELAAISHEKENSRTEAEPSSVPNTPSKRRSTASSILDTSLGGHTTPILTPKSTSRLPPLLKHFPTLLLLSSYLASTTPSKHDILLFSRLSSNSSHISKKIRRLKNTPTRRKPTLTSTSATNHGTSTPSKSRITKAILNASGSGATAGVVKPFSLERLLAILRAVHPSGIPNHFGKGISDRVYHELGELERLRLVVRSSSGSAGSTATASGSAAVDDATEEKWRVNVGRDWVVTMGQVWGMSVSEYEIEGDV
jgi:origin recognition complex subunit 5